MALLAVMGWLPRRTRFSLRVQLNGGSRVARPALQQAPLFVFAGTCVLVLLAGQGCKQSAQSPVGITITLIDQSWADKESQGRLNEELRQLTDRSSIGVEVLLAPE